MPLPPGTFGTLQKTDEYAYGNANWGDLLTKYGNTNIIYDVIGNPLVIGSAELDWQGRQLVEWMDDYISYSFEYNADGIRTAKTMSESIVGYESRKEYMLDGSRIIGETMYETFDVSQGFTEQYTFIYLYDETGAPIGLKYRTPSYANGVFDCYFFEKNLQGNIVAIYNESGAKVGTYTYDAWGNCTNPTSGYNFILSNNPFRYRGYYYDTETGFYYLQSRYYNPTWGRFINPDNHNVLLVTPDQLTDKNLFAYCDNNPIMRIDEDGEFWGAITGAVFGAISGGLKAYLAGDNILAGIGIGAAAGAISGLAVDLSIATGGLAGVAIAAIVGAASSALEDVATECVNGRGKEIDTMDVILNASYSAVTNVISMGMGLDDDVITGAKSISQMFKNASQNFSNSFMRNSRGILPKKISSRFRNAGKNAFSEFTTSFIYDGMMEIVGKILGI